MRNIFLLAVLILSNSRSFAEGELPKFNWRCSLALDSLSSGIAPIGGTEIKAFATMDGKLFAANSYFNDTQVYNPKLPGAQVYVLETSTGQWRVDLELDDRIQSGPDAGIRRFQAMGTMYTAHFTKSPVLLVGVWDRAGGLRVYSRTPSTPWIFQNLVENAPKASQVRSFGFHEDHVTNVERVFAGASPFGIFSGVLDPGPNGSIRWDKSPEPLDKAPHQSKAGRVMSFAQSNGKLYATIGWDIYERQDGPSPWWKQVYYYDRASNPKSSGLRGLTSVQNPNGPGEVLLFSTENNPHGPFAIMRLMPLQNYQAIEEINLSKFLSERWQTRVTTGIAAYNDMLIYPLPSENQDTAPLLLIGFEARIPQTGTGVGPNQKTPGAHFLIRDPNGNYSVRAVRDQNINPRPQLVSTRTIILSPFPEDPPGTIYAGGYDAGHMKPHNTAWVYKGTIRK